MTLEEDRVSYFTSWRNAIDEDDFIKCELSLRYLLSTLDENHTVRLDLESFYNSSLLVANIEVTNIAEEQRRERPLRRPKHNIRYYETARTFWLDMYNNFFQAFMKNSLIPKEK